MKVSLDWKGSFGGVEVGIVKCKACAIFVLFCYLMGLEETMFYRGRVCERAS